MSRRKPSDEDISQHTYTHTRWTMCIIAGWIKRKNQWKAIFLSDLVYDIDPISTNDLLTFVPRTPQQGWPLLQKAAIYVTWGSSTAEMQIRKNVEETQIEGAVKDGVTSPLTLNSPSRLNM